MTAITYETVILIKHTKFGSDIRTTATLLQMLEEICMNSGLEIASQCEAIAKKCADKWREPEPEVNLEAEE